MSKTLFLIFVFALLFTGCTTKEVQTEYIYKDVYIPIKCNAKMPLKPQNDGSFEADKQKMIYFVRVEELLKKCIGVEDEDK